MNHKAQKITLYISIVSVSLFLAYLLFSKSESKSTSILKEDYATRTDYKSGAEALRADKQDASLFDSENGFLDFSKTGATQEPPQSENMAAYDPANISPEERERRKRLAIEKFKPLLKIFPNNRYIPREKSEEELANEQKKNEMMFSIQERILSGDELTSDESLFFYTEKKQELAEKLEILNYAKEQFASNPQVNSVTNKLITSRLESIQARSDVYEKEIKTAEGNGADLKNFNWQ